MSLPPRLRLLAPWGIVALLVTLMIWDVREELLRRYWPEEEAQVAPSVAAPELLDSRSPREKAREEAARREILETMGGELNYLEQDAPNPHALRLAIEALEQQGIRPSGLQALAVIDYSKPSFLRRMALYSPVPDAVPVGPPPPEPISQHLCAHGTGSGDLFAETFSNVAGSHQSSLGLYRVGRRYVGKHGSSLRLHGLEKGRNDRAYDRAIVLHSAWYASYRTIRTNLHGEGIARLGRSLGCPAVPHWDLAHVLRALAGESYLYIHGGG